MQAPAWRDANVGLEIVKNTRTELGGQAGVFREIDHG